MGRTLLSAACDFDFRPGRRATHPGDCQIFEPQAHRKGGGQGSPPHAAWLLPISTL